MKIALSPDLHCFYNTYDKLDKNGESKRKNEWKRLQENFVRFAKNKRWM